MVHPQVLENVGIDPANLKGLPLGGIERLAMINLGLVI